MQLLKRYEELIERDANDISILWKLLQMLFYFVCAVAGYVTTYTFYMFQDLLNHRCILWATPSFDPSLHVFIRGMTTGISRARKQSWQARLQITLRNELHCSSILMISILSCACGVIGFSFFWICGRGGYQNRIYDEPWRLVVPAIVFNFCMSLLSLESAYDFDHGFKSFQYSLNKLLNRSGNEPIMEYLQTRHKTDHQHSWQYVQIIKVRSKNTNPQNKTYAVTNNSVYYDKFMPRNVCLVQFVISSWIGAAAWMVGFLFLILRVVNITDFRMLKVSIYTSKAIADNPRDESVENEPGET